MIEKCEDCQFLDIKEFECKLNRKDDIWTIGHKDIPDWCPLKEVKE